jgi:hypothetical protein
MLLTFLLYHKVTSSIFLVIFFSDLKTEKTIKNGKSLVTGKTGHKTLTEDKQNNKKHMKLQE